MKIDVWYWIMIGYGEPLVDILHCAVLGHMIWGRYLVKWFLGVFVFTESSQRCLGI